MRSGYSLPEAEVYCLAFAAKKNGLTVYGPDNAALLDSDKKWHTGCYIDKA